MIKCWCHVYVGFQSNVVDFEEGEAEAGGAEATGAEAGSTERPALLAEFCRHTGSHQ